MGEQNPWVGRVYLADNRRMPVPPSYFLAALYDYDAMLTLLPSRDQPFTYVLARRRQLTAGLTHLPCDEHTPPDTKMCLENDVLPICRVFHHGVSWDPTALLAKLQARDLWRHGGGDAAADLLDAQDAAADAKNKADIRADLYNRSGDGWRTYQARTGQRVLGRDLVPDTANGAAGSTAPSSSIAGSGVHNVVNMTIGERG